jgi:hypothetical protein
MCEFSVMLANELNRQDFPVLYVTPVSYTTLAPITQFLTWKIFRAPRCSATRLRSTIADNFIPYLEADINFF